MDVEQQDYQLDILVQGYPGKSVCHGGLGWSTIVLLRGNGRVALIDCGTFSHRSNLIEGLQRHGLTPADVTDVVLTHSHHDHAINWVLFPEATIWIGSEELDWSVREPWGSTPVPELYVRELAGSPQLKRIKSGDTVLPGLVAYDAPGHTPGHLIFLLSGRERDVLFTGDAAKNRVELLTRRGGHDLRLQRHRGVDREHVGAVAQASRHAAGAGPRSADDAGERQAGVRRQAAGGDRSRGSRIRWSRRRGSNWCCNGSVRRA